MSAPETTLKVPVFALRRVTKRWPAHSHAILDGIDLDVHPGEIVWVGGANGTGKTTLLRIAAGLIRADTGRVTVAGFDPERESREFRRRVGFLSAGNTGLYARLSGRLQLELTARLALLPAAEARLATERSIERFALEPLLAGRCDRLSLGQRQRLRLALAFLHDPRVVMMDEPATSLDEGARALLENAVLDFAAGGGAVIWCSPVAGALEGLAQRRYVLRGKRLESQ